MWSHRYCIALPIKVGQKEVVESGHFIEKMANRTEAEKTSFIVLYRDYTFTKSSQTEVRDIVNP
jgi:hypothetical protein